MESKPLYHPKYTLARVLASNLDEHSLEPFAGVHPVELPFRVELIVQSTILGRRQHRWRCKELSRWFGRKSLGVDGNKFEVGVGDGKLNKIE
jgi:hypothetical protein